MTGDGSPCPGHTLCVAAIGSTGEVVSTREERVDKTSKRLSRARGMCPFQVVLILYLAEVAKGLPARGEPQQVPLYNRREVQIV